MLKRRIYVIIRTHIVSKSSTQTKTTQHIADINKYHIAGHQNKALSKLQRTLNHGHGQTTPTHYVANIRGNLKLVVKII